MPCSSGYLEPENHNIRISEIAKSLLYLKGKLGRQTTELEHYCSSAYNYPTREHGDLIVQTLCFIIRELTPSQVETLVYDAHDKEARRLADFWDEHKTADAERNTP